MTHRADERTFGTLYLCLLDKCFIIVMYDGPLESWREKNSEWRAMTAFLNSGQVF